ncbi:MAG: hypothetical protein PHN64_08665 [Desulfovibrionaceae bacterium]|nr:hypothetical protein [Desulfovibrionaceae bacterium]
MTQKNTTSAQGGTQPDKENAPHASAKEQLADAASKAKAGAQASISAVWLESQHKDLIFYLAVAILMLELIVGGVAFFYGLIHATPDPQGGPPQFQFPWLGYALAAVLTPAALLLIVHLAGVGLFRSVNKDKDEAWRQDLPERLRKVYAIIQGAPTVVLLVGVMLIGAAIFYIDGAMQALYRLAAAAEPYLPWIIGGIVLMWCVGFGGRTWLRYHNKRIEEEYAFRREIFEKTGTIIVDQGAMHLPMNASATALPAGTAVDEGNNGALPAGVVPQGKGDIVDVVDGEIVPPTDQNKPEKER